MTVSDTRTAQTDESGRLTRDLLEETYSAITVNKVRSGLTILGIVIGTALLQVLQNLVNLLGIPSSLNFAVMGAVVLVGVLSDQLFQRRAGQKRRKLLLRGRGNTSRISSRRDA